MDFRNVREKLAHKCFTLSSIKTDSKVIDKQREKKSQNDSEFYAENLECFRAEKRKISRPKIKRNNNKN